MEQEAPYITFLFLHGLWSVPFMHMLQKLQYTDIPVHLSDSDTLGAPYNPLATRLRQNIE